MKRFAIKNTRAEWKILKRTKRSAGAIMTLAPGTTEGGPWNKHPHSDQWLFVLSGNGKAKVKSNTVRLSKGVLLLIEAGETHTIFAAKNSTLVTLNFYGPPAKFS